MVKDSHTPDSPELCNPASSQEKISKQEYVEVSVSDKLLTTGHENDILGNGHGSSCARACDGVSDSVNRCSDSPSNVTSHLSINNEYNTCSVVNRYIEKDVDDDNSPTHSVAKLSMNLKNPEKDKNGDTQKDKSSILEGNQDQEFVFLQDMGFTVKLAVPGLEPFDIQVSSIELVQEIHQLLMDREDTCHHTCVSLQLDGTTLDNFSEIKNIEGLKEGSVIKVVEEPYTMREARIHVRHVRDLLKSIDPADSYNGIDCISISYLNVVTQGDILEKKKSRPNFMDCTPPNYIMPGNRECSLVPLLPQIKDQKGPQALKVLMISGWNPPPGIRKLHGDLLYLYVVTLEEKRVYITASTRGFYVNQTTEEELNTKPANPKHVYHSLIDLLGQISPAFKRNFAIIQKKRTQRHPFERVATPYQLYTWTAPLVEHTVDSIRAEDAFSSKLGYEEHIPGQTRDWNEELQTTREIPKKTLPERLLRERAIFKVHSDFVAAATRGAMAVIDGNIMAINPGDETKMQMFIWNNIFFSLGFDVKDNYKELGGDAAAFVAPCNDLKGVRAYNTVDVDGLYTLGTVVVDYRGYRVTCQSIIPGILEREQEQSVVYGSVDFGKTVVSHKKYMELLDKAGQHLKILPHKVANDKGDIVELCSSVECKGIIGNDGRHYILDLLRAFPPDVNFLILDDEGLSKEAQSLGFPREHKHKLCCLRQELVDAFVEARYVMFIKLAAYGLQEIGLKNLLKDKEKGKNMKDEKTVEEIKEEERKVLNDSKLKENDDKEKTDYVPSADRYFHDSLRESEDLRNLEDVFNQQDDEFKKIAESIVNGKETKIDNTKEIIKQAAQAVGSLKESEYDIRFNPDVYNPGVQHPETEKENLKKQQQLVKDAAYFLLTVQIPSFIRDCLEHSTSPIDGTTLTEALHSRGINIRYLGKVAEMLAKIPQLQYVYAISVQELISRSAKHQFMAYLQAVETMSLAAAISHFLNCFLSSCLTLPAPIGAEELQFRNSKRKGKRKNKQNSFLVQDNNEWTVLTPRSFWSNLKAELQSYYNWTLEVECVDAVVEHYGIQKISLLRSFCMKCGVQILLKEYSLDNHSRSAFTEDDILNVFPVVKHINPRATDAYNFCTTGQNKIQQGFLKEGYELITKALNLLNNVYGVMHPEIAQCLRMLARLNYIMGDHTEAIEYQQKAVLMSERVNGIDHPYNITEYTNLALYCFANSQVSTALKLLYRSRYLALLICGENHPEIAMLDSNIGLVLHAIGEYDLSLSFLQNALKLNSKYYGNKSLKVAISYHLVARTQSCMGDFRAALQNEKETFSIYKAHLGEDHEKTRESSECLRHLTQQAVVLQKKMNEIYKGKPGATLPPIQIQPPSMSNVLGMLNIINGILFVHISQQDLEHFKAEFERHQQKETTADMVVNDDSLGSSDILEADKKDTASR
ncbi:clustered mitochondria protein homolog [Limulus polyphemus]|uniref:Clustered mitochondria protein homolog n=1 Tax=Limulus polyphemus TaxID=6850 RepID=A0ABM1T950_LIMPO|nr:clustered mitochondria protein homolog [Limulus polyphemus]XP_022252406.1 clustered mitochondria protein homolog [Limulus polyphemus]